MYMNFCFTYSKAFVYSTGAVSCELRFYNMVMVFFSVLIKDCLEYSLDFRLSPF
ncbi:hypothetical protein Syun_028284 [Stephania yunnanensis]|uniref:Uncharacterized protein n=1 Tax=Stephania yunnanensis TaxID=152371 RepID=A0AAP0HLS3_9MAGN